MRAATTVEGSAGQRWSSSSARRSSSAWTSAGSPRRGVPTPPRRWATSPRARRMLLGAGVSGRTRSPVLVAQTAMALSQIWGGRFLLGLGASGPQVIEGLHGAPFARPLGRLRETVKIVRRVFSGEKVEFPGRNPPSRSRAPSRAGRAAAGAGAGVSRDAVAADAGAHRGGRRRLARHQLRPGAGRRLLPPGRGPCPVRANTGRSGRLPGRRNRLWQTRVGRRRGQPQEGTRVLPRRDGHRHTNFYNAAYSRQGWADVAAPVRDRWQAGDRDGAAALVTDEMVLATTLIGTEDLVRARLATGATPVSTPSAVPGRRLLTHVSTTSPAASTWSGRWARPALRFRRRVSGRFRGSSL